MSKRPPPNYDYTNRQRAARQRARAAGTVPSVTLDADHALMLSSILAETGETATAWVRRMIREQAIDRPPGRD